MVFIRNNIKFLFVFILPVYFYIAQNSILNKHSHVYANGIVVTHSHPVNSDEDKPLNQHNHTKTEICLYSCLHFDFYETPLLVNIDFSHLEIQKHLLEQNDRSEYFSPRSGIRLRGPPSFFTYS